MACSLPHTDSEVKALVQRLINEDKGHQDALLNLAFQFEDSCAVRDDLRKAYEKCNDISQESHALICTLLKESSEKDSKLHLSMYGKAAQLEKQMRTNSAWFQEKYFGRTHGGTGCSSSQTDFPLTEKELHQLRMDEEALKEMLEEEAINKKVQEEKIRQEQAENDAFFLEFGVVRYDSERGSPVHRCNTRAYCATHHCGDRRGSFLEEVASAAAGEKNNGGILHSEIRRSLSSGVCYVECHSLFRLIGFPKRLAIAKSSIRLKCPHGGFHFWELSDMVLLPRLNGYEYYVSRICPGVLDLSIGMFLVLFGKGAGL
ncbi:hypothetical protein Tco_0184459 [Tanacetum coccineum]